MTAAQDTFWLVHYTYNTINPLVEEAKAIEPSAQLSIHTTFGHEGAAFQKDHMIEAHLHWSREGMLALGYGIRTKADVDKFAGELQTKIAKLRTDALNEARTRELNNPRATFASLAKVALPA